MYRPPASTTRLGFFGLLGGVAGLHMDHKSIMDVDDGGINLTGEEIDILGVADCQIAVNPSQRGGHQYTLVLGWIFMDNFLL